MAQPSTQDFLEFDQIRDGIMILKNKTLRAVLMVSSINFALKSAEEQEAILYQFQNFLNSLDFSCQILMLSRRLNITGYLDKLKEIEDKEENELLKVQITEYRKFIDQKVSGGSIMQKSFYVVVPLSIAESQIREGKAKLPKFSDLTREEFQRSKSQLMQRVEYVILGLQGSGLQAVVLNTLELIELFWGFNHPEQAEKGYYPDIPTELIR